MASICEVLRCRLLAKRGGLWRCMKCSSKITALYRGFGCWPVKGFEDIPEKERQAFFANNDGTPARGLVAAMNDFLEKFEVKAAICAVSYPVGLTTFGLVDVSMTFC